MNRTEKLLTDKFNIDKRVLALVAEAEEKVSGLFDELDDIMTYNQYKVLSALRMEHRLRL